MLVRGKIASELIFFRGRRFLVGLTEAADSAAADRFFGSCVGVSRPSLCSRSANRLSDRRQSRTGLSLSQINHGSRWSNAFSSQSNAVSFLSSAAKIAATL